MDPVPHSRCNIEDCVLPRVVNRERGDVHQAIRPHVHVVAQKAVDLIREWTAEEHDAVARRPASELHVLCESEHGDTSSHDGQCAKRVSPPLASKPPGHCESVYGPVYYDCAAYVRENRM